MGINKFKLFLIPLLVISFQQANAIHTKGENIQIENPWIRTAPSNAPILGAFMVIHNKTNNDLRLVSATAKNFHHVELHRTIKSDGIMKMVKQKFIPIAAHDKLVLQPGSWHIMLIKPTFVPKQGDMVPVVLVFDNGVVKKIMMKVKKSKHSTPSKPLIH